MEPITVYELQNLQHAARIFEMKGADGYQEVADKFGNDMAKGMLVMYLRAIHGSIRGREADRNVPAQVKALLRNYGILNDAEAQNTRNTALEAARREAEAFVTTMANTPEIAPPREREQQAAPHPVGTAIPAPMKDDINIEELLLELKKELEEK